MSVNDFTMQSQTIIELLMQRHNMDRTRAMQIWFKSKTYAEILRRKLFYISATRAYSELLLEQQNNSEWMRNSFDL